MFALSNAEYVVLSLIAETGPVSGYRLNEVVVERGYRQWADIGTTSIYGALKKLETKHMIQGALIKKRPVQGPAAKEFVLTTIGKVVLVEETAKGLSETRERDRRFDVALSSMSVLPHPSVLSLLEKRKALLVSEAARIGAVYERGKHTMSIEGELLFRHTLNFIRSEIDFLGTLLDGGEKELRYDYREL